VYIFSVVPVQLDWFPILVVYRTDSGR